MSGVRKWAIVAVALLVGATIALSFAHAQTVAAQSIERDRLISQQRYAEALPLAEKIAATLGIESPGSKEHGGALRALGDVLFSLDRRDEALKKFAESIAAYEKSGGGDSLEVSAAWHTMGRASYSIKDMDAAETSLKRALAIRERLASESLECAATVSELGNLAYSRGQLPEADSWYQRALSIREKTAPGSLYVAISMTTIGNVALSRGDLGGAEKQYQGALEIFQAKAPGSLGESQVLNNLAGVARERGDLTKAEESYARALVIQQKISPESVDVARTLSNLGAVTWSRGDLPLAQVRLEAALAIQQVKAPGSLEIASTLNNLGTIAKERGDLDVAQSRYDSALVIQIRIAPNSLSVASSLSNIGNVAKDRGDLGLAQDRFQQAMAIRMRLAPDSLEVANSHVALGVVAMNRGDLVLAQSRFDSALAIQERIAPSSLAVAQTLNLLGGVARLRGDMALAQARFEAALKIQKRLAKDSLGTAQSLDDIGAVAWSRGEMDDARIYFDEALAIYTRLSPQSLNVASSHTNLGVVAHELRDYSGANNRFESALEIQERIAPGSLAVAMSLSNLGSVAFDQGDFATAKSRYEASLKIRSTLAPRSLEEAAGLNDLDAAVRYQGDLATSNALLKRRLNDLREFLSRESASGVQSNAAETLVANAIKEIGIHADADTTGALYEGLIGLRGLSLSMESRQRSATLASREDPAVRSAQSAFSVAMKAETDWIQKRSASITDKEFQAKLVEIRGNVDKARRTLAAVLRSRDPRMEASKGVAVGDVQARLPNQTVLVEYVRVSGWDSKQKKDSDDEYGAFLVAQSGAPRWFPLGKSAIIDEYVQEFQDLIAFSDGSQRGSAEDKRLEKVCGALFSLLIKPLGDLPEGLIVVPDAALFQLPFGALMDEDGKYMIEKHLVSLSGSGRDLVEAPDYGSSAKAVVLGGPQFDVDPTLLSARREDESPFGLGTHVVRGAALVGKWEPLAGALAESVSVAKALNAELLTGSDATEENLMAVNSPSVLHIATHGFFYPPAFDDKSSRAVLEGNGIGRGLKVADSPMLRSGLILAGANDEEDLRREGAMDGWGTALELSQMDLRGTELVVLSGCETGKGDYRLGKGIFGLQRAFRFAGSRTLVMSLFKVPDTATKTLFENFYASWRPGMHDGSKLAAMREAQLTIMRNPSTRSPKNWAGFVLMGGR